MDPLTEKSDPQQDVAEPPADDGSDSQKDGQDWGDEFFQMAPKAKANAA